MEGSLRAVDRMVSAAAEILVGFNVFPRYREAVSDERNDQERAGQVDSRTGRVQRFSLNSGGNTDEGFALSI